jgi:hypothetical protein
MKPIQAFRLFRGATQAESVLKGNATPMKKASQIVALVVQLIGTLGLATVATNWTDHHLMLVVGINLALTVGHALLPSVVPAPVAANPPDLSKFGAVLLAALLLAPMVHAQSAVNATVPPVPVPLTNIYAAGVSYSVNATPSVAGTALYAHLIASSGTYAFTAVDALPNTLKPFTVSTNIGVGIGQKVATLGSVPIYVPTAAGISFNGANTGWQWNAGALASVHVRGNYYILPSVRFLKSSVSGGTGYQPIIGVLFGWGN